MSQSEELVKFIEVLEPLTKKHITKDDVEAIEKAVEDFYSALPSLRRDTIQDNALSLLGENAYKITSMVKTDEMFEQTFHRICQLSTEFFNNSGDPMMLVAYLGIMSEYYLNKNITKKEQS